jgi:hypothetical protein|tara:strand:+ start:238 stop:432 length:195 start_codon:yes stop_codon:yes gene_type:complete
MNSINIHNIDKVEVKTSEFNWGQAITIEVTATDGVQSEIVLYEQGTTNVVHSYKMEIEGIGDDN